MPTASFTRPSTKPSETQMLAHCTSRRATCARARNGRLSYTTALVSAIVVLVEPRFPDFRGIKTFEGDAFAVHPDDVKDPNCRRNGFHTQADVSDVVHALCKFFL